MIVRFPTRRRGVSRLTALLVLLSLPIVYAIGWISGPGQTSIRDAEAVPVPRELPIDVSRFHDATAGVTCYRIGAVVSSRAALSCLPDRWLLPAREVETP